MCGIIGIASSDRSLILEMVDTLKHRGPDDSGIFVDDLVSLGNCRLKVIDLTPRGHQPMSNEDGTIWITFNGEIYNAAEIRKVLEQMGHSFVSDSDTECIVHGYETWGTNVVNNLNGMWGFCIYDSLKNILFLSRDRMGVKPVIYCLTNEMFAFSSELKVFAEVKQLRRPFSLPGITEQLIFGFNPSARTALDSVFKLKAGENLVYNLGAKVASIQRYWNNLREKNGILDAEHVENLINESIALHLVSEVPVGCYLSGGVDSSTIALKWSEQYSKTLHTFTIGFEGEEDETKEAKEIADFLGSNHHELILTSELVAKNLSDLLYYYDLTMNDGAFVPNYFISKLARNYVTVTLAGEGGDEVFGGYDYYGYFSRIQRLIPLQRIRKMSAGIGLMLFQSFGEEFFAYALSRPGKKGRRLVESFAKGFYALKNEGKYSEFIYGYLGEIPYVDFKQLNF